MAEKLTAEMVQAGMDELAREKPLNVISEDAYGCCGAIRKAVKENPDMKRWGCPKCELNWKPRLVDGIRLWEARPTCQIWKRR